MYQLVNSKTYKLVNLFTIFAYFLFANCATVAPYKITNYFRSSKIEERNIKRVAVLPFENLTKETRAPKVLSEEFNLQLGKTLLFDLVERARIEELFKEQDLDTTFRFDPSQAVKIGKMLGAQGVILGSVTKFIPYPEVIRDTTERRESGSSYPAVVIVDDGRRDGWKTFLIVISALTVVGLVFYLLLAPRPASAEVGISVRLVDVETGEVLWQAKETFRGDRKGIQALVKDKEEKKRLIYDIDYLTQILCEKIANTIVR